MDDLFSIFVKNPWIHERHIVPESSLVHLPLGLFGVARSAFGLAEGTNRGIAMDLLMARKAGFHGRRLLAEGLSVHHAFGRPGTQTKRAGGGGSGEAGGDG